MPITYNQYWNNRSIRRSVIHTVYQKSEYKSLNSKQKEIYNFQKLSGILADYGFNYIKLSDDWQGADFLAYSNNDKNTLKVHLKGRISIYDKYSNKGLVIAFPHNKQWI